MESSRSRNSNCRIRFWWLFLDPTVNQSATEEYDGSLGLLVIYGNSKIYLAGCGTQTAALGFGG
jgi:hypothetical protein